MKFDDLKFKADPDGLPLIRARAIINNFELSVVQESNHPGRYEFAVFNALGEMIQIEGIHNSDTVVRFATPEGVEEVMQRLSDGITPRNTMYT